MNFKRNSILFFLAICILLAYSKSFAQTDTCNLRISLLTCTPGDELYSTFGHSAIRITDSASGRDVVYNYGTFNFDEPGFYTKFIRGKLLYYLSTEDFASFAYGYQMQNRDITEQVLQLTCAEKYNTLLLLQTNLIPTNRFYKYDFTFDNCTTRLRDLIEKSSPGELHFGDVLQRKATFRDLIYEYLDYNDKQWSKLGIDLLLGSPLDVNITPYQSMFLPDYLMKSFDSSTIGSKALISKKFSLFDIETAPAGKKFFTNPLFIFSLVFLLVLLLSFSKNILIARFLDAFDGFLVFITGIMGCLFILMWTGTEHLMCKNNYNILWAWPTNVIMAFYFHSKRQSPSWYFLVYAVFNLLLIAGWLFLPQHLNPSIIPVIGIIVFRSLFHRYYQKEKKYEPYNFSK